MSKMFKGAVVVVDDEIDRDTKVEGAGKTDIKELLLEVEKKGYPCATLVNVPKDIDGFVSHLHSVAFLILDWRLNDVIDEKDDTDTLGVTTPEKLGDRSIDLVTKIQNSVFLPVFIFTNEVVAEVEEKLVDAGLFDQENKDQNFIFVRKKGDLKGEKLFEEIDAWLAKSPSIYVLKEWEREYQEAKSNLFWGLYGQSHTWPQILWDVYEADDGLPSSGLGDVITTNLHTRMSPFKFNEAIVKSGDKAVNPNVIRAVLEGERFIKADKISNDSILPGDFYFLDDVEGSWKYRINIRASCDTARDDNPELFLLKGRELTEIDSDLFQHNNYVEKNHQCVIPCLHNGKIIEFTFRHLKIEKWNNIKAKRTGRLLAPYLSKLQDGYGAYMQRHGLLELLGKHFFRKIPNKTKNIYKFPPI